MPILLAIESSCDETAVAILRGQRGEMTEILTSEVASQIELHREYGGVVPELASRNHALAIRPLLDAALNHAGISLAEVDAFAATTGPGLASSLMIGASAAKGLACATGKPFLAINHMEGHLLSPFLSQTEVPPHLALIISGGHTLLIDVQGAGRYRLVGTTRDDAVGEAFDKVAKMLGLPYPGGPELEKIAKLGNPHAFDFPRSMLHAPHADFSFSGLKTAVLYTIQGLGDHAEVVKNRQTVADIAASFQQAVSEILVGKCRKNLGAHHTIALSGGVSCNQTLRDAFERAFAPRHVRIAIAPPALCTDNAAMIAFAALLRFLNGESSPLTTEILPNWQLV